MAKTREQKEKIFNSAVVALKDSAAVVFANISGLTVKETQELKRQAKEKGVSSTLVKKTILKKAFEQAKIDAKPEEFKGGVGVFSSPDPVAAAKIVSEYGKIKSLVAIFGGVFEGRFVDAASIVKLASIPGKTELLAKFVGALSSPISGFANVLAGNLRNLVSVLNNINKQKTQ